MSTTFFSLNNFLSVQHGITLIGDKLGFSQDSISFLPDLVNEIVYSDFCKKLISFLFKKIIYFLVYNII